MWLGVRGGEVSRAVWLVDRLWCTRCQTGTADRNLFSNSECLLLIHITRSLSADAKRDGVKKVALLVLPEGLSSSVSGFAIRMSRCPSPRSTRTTRNDVDFAELLDLHSATRSATAAAT